MQAPMKVVGEGPVEERLQQLGLTSQILRQAVSTGLFEKFSCTNLDPPNIPGTEFWRWSIRNLRESLVPFGWRPENRNNLPLVVEPVRAIALMVKSGSPGTGSSDGMPTTKYDQGPLTCGMVQVNRQLHLFSSEIQFLPSPSDNELTTWMLLVYSTPILDPESHATTGAVAYCELSLPREIDEKRYVSEWGERIILDPVYLSESTISNIDADEEDDNGVDVEVSWLT